MARSSTARWLLACAASAVLLSAIVLALGVRDRAAREDAAPAPGLEDACELPLPSLVRAHAEAEHPPVVLWAAGGARLFVDGRAAFSPPEAPRRFPPGPIAVRVEAAGHAPVETIYRLDPFRPALIHAEVDPEVGLVLLGLGVVCERCEAPLTELRIGQIRAAAGAPLKDALAQAAAALREDDWQLASQHLATVPPGARSGPLARRLFAAAYLRAEAPEAARAALDARGATQPGDLPALLRRLDALAEEEQRSQAEVTLARWNRLTGQHAALVRVGAQRAGVDVGVGEAAARVAQASARFGDARAEDDGPGQARAFVEAEAAVAALLSRLAEGGCERRAQVVAALAGEAAP